MAGQTGQSNLPVMPKNIYESLREKPTGFTFAQAVGLLRKKLGSRDKTAIKFKVNPNLSFPASDIDNITFEDDENGDLAGAEITLNLMGLHGAASPLPSYFTEHVAQKQDEECVLKDFLDIFNHQLIGLFYSCWEKYRYHVQFEENAADRMSSRFLSFLGLGHQALIETTGLDIQRLMPYMGLIAFSSEAAGSLESILRHYFCHDAVYVTHCIIQQVPVSDDQKSSLGLSNSNLDDCVLGEMVNDQTGKFRISIAELSWDMFNNFLPCGKTFPPLQNLVRFVMRSPLAFDVELHLKPENVPPLTLSENSECRLAWSTWLGETGADGIVVLETDSAYDCLDSARQ